MREAKEPSAAPWKFVEHHWRDGPLQNSLSTIRATRSSSEWQALVVKKLRITCGWLGK